MTELNTTALALAALLGVSAVGGNTLPHIASHMGHSAGLSLACLAYYKCAKPVLDEQDSWYHFGPSNQNRSESVAVASFHTRHDQVTWTIYSIAAYGDGHVPVPLS